MKKFRFDTVCYLGFTFSHKSKIPNKRKNVPVIREAILDKLSSMTDDDIIRYISYGDPRNSFQYSDEVECNTCKDTLTFGTGVVFENPDEDVGGYLCEVCRFP